MDENSYEHFVDQLRQLYQQGAYEQALALLQQTVGSFPGHEHDLYYWRMCLASCANDLPLALQSFRELLEQGHWLPPRWLREDKDLLPLQGLPEYEEMVAICQQKFAETQANAKPELLMMHPDGGVTSSIHPYSLLVALHGNGGNNSGTLRPWSWAASHDWFLVLPQSSQVIGNNAYVWDDWDKAAQEIREHYVSLTHRYAIGEKVIVGGFSMGGGLAIWLAMSGVISAHGFVVLGPYLPNLDTLTPLLASARAEDLRGYIIVGERDEVCLDISRKVNDLLNANGIPCQLELRPGLGHNYPPDFDLSLEKALAFVTQA